MSLTLLAAGLIRAVAAVVPAVAVQPLRHTASVPAGKLSGFARHCHAEGEGEERTRS